MIQKIIMLNKSWRTYMPGPVSLFTLILIGTLATGIPAQTGDTRPNIIMIMADDMGYSDIGAFGGEIQTPVIDELGAGGIKYSRFYNAGRCCPTRATLLTGLYPHQSGLGEMVGPGDQTATRGPGYAGEITNRTVTVAEVLKSAGYSTYMVGKWHVSANEGLNFDNLPNQRGFDRFFGLYNGASNFFTGSAPSFHRLATNNTIIPVEDVPDDFYFTRNISDTAVTYIDEHTSENPFFMYVAHTAPHWPLNALAVDIAKYRGNYMTGWDEMRTDRLYRMNEIGLADDTWQMTPRDARAWEDVTNKDEMDHRMAIYAAQVDHMDQGIGKIVQALKDNSLFENTLILFFGDNGGNHEGGELGTGGADLLGTDAGYRPGSTSILSYGRAWGNASNTPFRRYKSQVHEGGIASPMIAHWPLGIARAGEWDRSVTHILDMMPTFVELAGATYPASFNGYLILPAEGVSLVPTFAGNPIQRQDPLFWEHLGNRAVMDGNWKLVAAGSGGAWELYNLDLDRTELNNLAASDPDRTNAMSGLYDEWAERTFVYKKTDYVLTPALKFTSPTDGSAIPLASEFELTWGAQWRDVTEVSLEYNTGMGWQNIVASTPSDGNGSYTWTTPGEAGPVSLRVTSGDGQVSDSLLVNLAVSVHRKTPEIKGTTKDQEYDALGRKWPEGGQNKFQMINFK